ncbi:MAG: hypothetical protein V1664_04410 [Candidatus Uhrbacteria bacterium]
MEKNQETWINRALMIAFGIFLFGTGIFGLGAVWWWLGYADTEGTIMFGMVVLVIGLVGIVVVEGWALFGAIAVEEWNVLSFLLSPLARDTRHDWWKNTRDWGIGVLFSGGGILVLLTFAYLSGVFISKGQFLWMCATVVLAGMLTMRDVAIRTWPPRSPGLTHLNFT